MGKFSEKQNGNKLKRRYRVLYEWLQFCFFLKQVYVLLMSRPRKKKDTIEFLNKGPFLKPYLYIFEADLLIIES